MNHELYLLIRRTHAETKFLSNPPRKPHSRLQSLGQDEFSLERSAQWDKNVLLLQKNLKRVLGNRVTHLQRLHIFLGEIKVLKKHLMKIVLNLLTNSWDSFKDASSSSILFRAGSKEKFASSIVEFTLYNNCWEETKASFFFVTLWASNFTFSTRVLGYIKGSTIASMLRNEENAYHISYKPRYRSTVRVLNPPFKHLILPLNMLKYEDFASLGGFNF